MQTEPISSDTSTRICNHMNKDHPEAIKAYAKHYGGIQNVNNAFMVNLSNKSMEIDVDGKIINIKFNHILKDSSDAHNTLVEMLRSIPKN